MLYTIKIFNGSGVQINNFAAMIKNVNDEEKLQKGIFYLCESINTQPDKDISESDEYDYKTQNN